MSQNYVDLKQKALTFCIAFDIISGVVKNIGSSAEADSTKTTITTVETMFETAKTAKQ